MVRLVIFQGDREDAESNAFLLAQKLNETGEPIARVVRYSDLVFQFSGSAGGAKVKLARADDSIEEAGEAFYVRDYHGYQAERYALGAYLAEKGKKVFNSDTLNNEPVSKLEQLMAFAGAGIPTPESYFASDPRLLDKAKPYPFVVKSITSSNNRLNFLVRTEKEYARAVKNIGAKVLVQEYIENDGDYKAILMAGEPVGIYKRTQSNGFQVAGRPGRAESREKDVDALARRTAKALRREFCSVDIVRQKNTGKLFVLECNFNSGLYIAGAGIDEAFFKKTAQLLKRQP